MDVQQQHQQQQQETGFTIVSLDESFFFYDSLVRRYGLIKIKDLLCEQQARINIHAFLVLSVLQVNNYSESMTNSMEIHLNFLKIIHSRFPKCYLFMDKASPHYKSKKVLKYFEDNKDTLIPAYLSTASPEFLVMEEVRNIAKRDLLVLKYYPSFSDFKEKISCYFRTKRFNLDMRNYLLREV
jgi:hypothetical protein